MASASAKPRIVSSMLVVRRSGDVISLPLGYFSLGFQPLLDCFESSLERRAGFVNGHFSYDAAFKSRQPSLLGTLQSDQIEAGTFWIGLIQDADRQVKSGFKVMARVELLLGNRIDGVRRARTSINDRLYNPKRGLEPKVYFFPIEFGLDVFRSCFWIVEQIAIEVRQINGKCFGTAEQGSKRVRHCGRIMFVPVCSKLRIPTLDVSL